MHVIILAFNSITAYRMLTAHYRMLLNRYRYQIMNNFEKLLDQDSIENTFIIMSPILLIIYIHIWQIRFLENDVFNAKFDTNQKLYPRSINWTKDNNDKIEKAIVIDKDIKNEEKDLWKRNKQLKKKKKYQKWAA